VRSIFRAAARGVVAPTRMVWLPGAYHYAEDFLEAGFDTEVRERALPLDLVFVDLELEHLGDRSALEQLQREIVAPARDLGCRSIWLAGISLGGFIALAYAAAHGADWDGLCLLAPYLGNRMLIDEIAAAPGLPGWRSGPLAQADEERRIWHLIQTQRAESRPMYLGYGSDDRFARAHGLMAEALPPDAVNVVSGGHDWPTWTRLWERFLDTRFK
jgi:pimeloyl-ACP methyl ester carboxylesterase